MKKSIIKVLTMIIGLAAFMACDPMKDVYDELDKNEFVKTHRSYLVNLQYIEKITKSECLLVDNRKVPLSRNSYKSVNSSFIEYHKCRRF